MQTALAFGCSAWALCKFSDNAETCGSCSSAATGRVLGVLWRVLGVLWLSEVTTVLTGVEACCSDAPARIHRMHECSEAERRRCVRAGLYCQYTTDGLLPYWDYPQARVDPFAVVPLAKPATGVPSETPSSPGSTLGVPWEYPSEYSFGALRVL